MAVVRVVVVLGWTAAAFAYAATDAVTYPQWAAARPGLAAWSAYALVMLWPTGARLGARLGAIPDVLLAFAVQRASTPVAPYPAATALFTLAVFAIAVLATPTGTRPVAIVVAAMLGGFLEALVMWSTGIREVTWPLAALLTMAVTAALAIRRDPLLDRKPG